MSKIVSKNSVITTHHYQSGYQYENGNLLFFPHAEGYVNVVSGAVPTYNYVYQYKDHLGKNRLSYATTTQASQTQLTILEESHYYPFGLKHAPYNNDHYQFTPPANGNNVALLPAGQTGNYQYKYNGKELQDELGLDMYDYGARNYDPAIGRWMNIDPLADVLTNLSPYNYVRNNPVKFIDPNGMIWLDPKEADRLKTNISNRISSLNTEKSELEAKLKDENLSEKQRNKILKNIGNIDSRVNSLNTSISDIDKLGADKNNTYDLVSGGELNYVKKGEDRVIRIQGPNDALHIHEIRHVSLSLSSEKGLEFSFGGLLKATTPIGAKDEISAYTAQYSYQPTSMPGSVSDGSEINIEYIANIRDSDDKVVYPAIYQRWLNQKTQEKLNAKNEKSKKKQGQ